MKIANNIIKYHLSHVYWVFGTACAGKTTTTKYLSNKFNMTLYDSDNKYEWYNQISNPIYQPQMNRKSKDWEEYFNRPPMEYAKALKDSMAEVFYMVVVDLLTMPKDKPIIVDSHCFTDEPSLISDYNNIIYLTTEADLVIDQFMQRDDKKDLYDLIMSLSNPEKKLKNLYDTLRLGHESEYKRIINSDMKYIIRREDTKVEQMAKIMEEHFRLR